MLSALLGTDRRRSLSPEGDRGYWPFGGGQTSSGQIVNSETAPRVASVYACVRVLSETLASSRCQVYKKKKSGGKDRATNLPIYSVLHDAPNQWQTAFEFWEMAMVHLSLRGNFYAAIIPGIKGAVTELIPMHPDRVKVDRLPTGRLRYTFTDPSTGAPDVYSQDEIFHIRGMSTDGLVGMSIIQYQKELIGGAMAADKYATSFFGNDATPGIVLSTEQSLTPEARNETRAQWEKWHRGADKAHRTAVLSNGLKTLQVGVNNTDAQFLETRGYNDSKIASIFRVPPHLIGIMDRATFSNIEQQSLEFITYTMVPWFSRIEASIKRDLLTDEGTFAEFMPETFLRGDIQSRYNAYAVGRNNGWLNGNEIREKENMNDMGEQGDVYLVQGAMVPIDRLINPPEPPAPVVADPSAVIPVQDTQPPDESAIEKSATEDARVIVDTTKWLAESAIESERRRADALEKLAQLAEAAKSELVGEVDELAKSLKEKDALVTWHIDEIDRLSKDASEEKSKNHNLSSSLNTAISGIKRLAANELRGLIRVEVNAMDRASHKHDFLSAMDKFYAEHKTRIIESMRHPLTLLSEIGGTSFDADKMAASHCSDSLNSLLEAAGTCTAENLPETISTLMANWEQRADFLEI